jgi:hypothetical protein
MEGNTIQRYHRVTVIKSNEKEPRHVGINSRLVFKRMLKRSGDKLTVKLYILSTSELTIIHSQQYIGVQMHMVKLIVAKSVVILHRGS